MGFTILGLVILLLTGLFNYFQKASENERSGSPDGFNKILLLLILIGACITFWDSCNSIGAKNVAEDKVRKFNDSLKDMQEQIYKLQSQHFDTAKNTLSKQYEIIHKQDSALN